MKILAIEREVAGKHTAEASPLLFADATVTMRCGATRFTARNGGAINNEPDIAYPYLFAYFPGEEYRTRGIVRNIMKQQFGTGASGLPGNDDAGAISAWFAFSALGFYPACPASGEYRLGVPLFKRAVITLNPASHPGGEFVISTNGKGQETGKLSVELNNQQHDPVSLSHRDIVGGGELRFIAGN